MAASTVGTSRAEATWPTIIIPHGKIQYVVSLVEVLRNPVLLHIVLLARGVLATLMSDFKALPEKDRIWQQIRRISPFRYRLLILLIKYGYAVELMGAGLLASLAAVAHIQRVPPSSKSMEELIGECGLFPTLQAIQEESASPSGIVSKATASPRV